MFEEDFEIEQLPYIVIELILQLKNCTYISKQEIVKGEIPSGYDKIKDYIIQAKSSHIKQTKNQLANITLEYV